MGPNSQNKDPRPAGVLNREILVVNMRILSLVREESGPAKRIRSLWRAIYWVRPRLEGIERYAEFLASKEYVLDIRTKITWLGKYCS